MNLRKRIISILTPDDYALDTDVVIGAYQCTDDILVALHEELIGWAKSNNISDAQIKDLWHRITVGEDK